MSYPCTESTKLAIGFRQCIPKASCDPKDKKCIVICTDYSEIQTTPGIYQYNLISNKSQIIYKYNNTIKPQLHSQFIDTSNNTLILYGGACNTFKVFDLNTNEIKQINDKNII
eukprot:427229_1